MSRATAIVAIGPRQIGKPNLTLWYDIIMVCSVYFSRMPFPWSQSCQRMSLPLMIMALVISYRWISHPSYNNKPRRPWAFNRKLLRSSFALVHWLNTRAGPGVEISQKVHSRVTPKKVSNDQIFRWPFLVICQKIFFSFFLIISGVF